MYWLDTAIVALLIVGAIFGALSGLLMQLARIFGFAVSLYFAILLNDSASSLCGNLFMHDAEPWLTRTVGYVAVFLLVYLLIFLITVVLERGLRGVRLQAVNRVLGALLGAVKVGLILGAVLLGLSHFPHPATKEMMERSALGPPLSESVETILATAMSQYGQDLRGGLEELAKRAPEASKVLEQLDGIKNGIHEGTRRDTKEDKKREAEKGRKDDGEIEKK